MRARHAAVTGLVFANLATALVGASFGHDAHAQGAQKHGIIAHALRPSATARAVGRSIGSPTDGHLVRGARLEASPWLRVVPCYEGAQWGLESLVSMIDRAARAVHRDHPDSMLSVGHLSRAGGGEIDRHASHESGRDADVGFYVVDWRGKPIYADHFVAFVGDGTAPSWPGARFDDARNWEFIASVVGDGHARVSNVFVAAPLRARLLAYAQRIGAPYALRVRAAETMMQPRGALPHDDHFHVRISCPGGMEGCIELPTRNLARASRQRGRSRSTIGHAAPAPRVDESPARPATSTPTPAPAPTLGAVPAPSPNREPSVEPPPGLLESPIDDVDGLDDE
jgi:penicillin-insensitive murein endopeptidase